MPKTNPTDHRVYQGATDPAGAARRLDLLPPPPPWRAFSGGPHLSRARTFEPTPDLVKIVNAALLLRRPILIEGEPGSGKTSLAYDVAEKLGLPGPFRWSITSRTSLNDGLYLYDALARLHDSQMPGAAQRSEDIGRYIRLGPVGMAFAVTRPKRPAVLLIDEIDKSDIDLPSDLLHLFEEGAFSIPELERLDGVEAVKVLPGVSAGHGDYSRRQLANAARISVTNGLVACEGEFPLMFMTSNQGREFPAPFLRRCLRVTTESVTDVETLLRLAREHLRDYDPGLDQENPTIRQLVERFIQRRQSHVQSMDQLFNAIVLELKNAADFTAEDGGPPPDKALLDALWTSLGTRQKGGGR